MVRVSASYQGGAGSGFGDGAFWGRGDRPPPPSREHFVAASAPEAYSSQISNDLVVGGPGRDDGPPNFSYETKLFAVTMFCLSVCGIGIGLAAEQKYLRDKALEKAIKKKHGGGGSESGEGTSRSAGRVSRSSFNRAFP